MPLLHRWKNWECSPNYTLHNLERLPFTFLVPPQPCTNALRVHTLDHTDTDWPPCASKNTEAIFKMFLQNPELTHTPELFRKVAWVCRVKKCKVESRRKKSRRRTRKKCFASFKLQRKSAISDPQVNSLVIKTAESCQERGNRFLRGWWFCSFLPFLSLLWLKSRWLVLLLLFWKYVGTDCTFFKIREKNKFPINKRTCTNVSLQLNWYHVPPRTPADGKAVIKGLAKRGCPDLMSGLYGHC